MIGFVLLNYLAYEETFNCVESILQLKGDKVIIIIDNFSPNNSGEILEQRYLKCENVFVIKNTSNEGFAKGNNIGYRFLKEKYDCDFIVIMNTDMEILDKDFIAKIEESYYLNKFYVLGPDIYSTRDNRHQNPENYSNYSLKTLYKIKNELLFKKYFSFLFFIKWFVSTKLKINFKQKQSKIKKYSDKDYLRKKENVVLHGSCLIFSMDFIKKEEAAFYEKTFMYFESYILHYLCMKKNYKMIYDPITCVFHHEDASVNMAYTKTYKKAIFGNKCLLHSCREFIRLIKIMED